MVEMVEPDALVDGNDIPWHTDPSEPYGMHLDPVLTRRNASVVVALLDSGMAARAIDLWKPVGGYCFISSPDFTNTDLGRNPDFTDPGDQGPTCPTPTWHGTKVASVVKAVAPYAKLSVLRVLGRCGAGFASDVTDAIVWAAGGKIGGVKANPFPAKVISMSLAGRGPCPSFLQSAVNQAVGLGATLIAAAGNAGADATLYFPGNCKGVLSIGASTRQGTLAAYSNWGETLAFSAPGGDGSNPVQVVGVGTDGQLVQATAMGTSFAAPHVAGVLALLQVVNVSLDQGGKYVPCVGGCGVKGILNGVDRMVIQEDAKIALGNLLDTTTNNSVVSIAGETCAYGVDETRGADRYGGLYSFDVSCPVGQYVCSYGLCAWAYWTRYVAFYCCSATGGLIPIPYLFGITSWSRCEQNLNAPLNSEGFNNYVHTLDKSAIASNYNSWYIHYGFTQWQVDFDRGSYGPKQTCQGDEKIVGFHGWFGEALDQSNIYCRRTCKCAPGQYNNNGVCSSCPSGKYSASAGAYSCSDCPSGKYSASAGAYSCSDCGSCPNQQYRSGCGSSAGVCVNCEPCAAGQYRVACAGLSAGVCIACGYCGSNEYTSGCSGAFAGTCISCPNCPANAWLSGCGGTQAGTCLPCQDCGVGEMLTGCPGGSSADRGSCIRCANGEYSAGWFTRICSKCQPGKYSDHMVSSCTYCPTGKYYTGTGAGSCVGCERGTFSTTLGAVTSAACGDCPQGTYNSAVGRTVCTLCSPGSYYPNMKHLGPDCTFCESGKYSTGSGGVSVNTCLECSPGHFSGSTGQSTCTKCSAGFYSKDHKSTGCTPCNLDTHVTQFQNLEGQSDCKTCNNTNCKTGEHTFGCTPTKDKVCSTCPPYPNCVYLSSGGCTRPDSSTPGCSCVAGFQMINSTCVQCPAGTWKKKENFDLCTNWTNIKCDNGQFMAKGTRIEDSKCVPFPTVAPANAMIKEVEWRCNAGYEKT